MWDDVPWYVGGGAEHSEEVARLLPFLAARGNEGVLAGGHCKVTELDTPGAGVQIAPGVATVLNRGASMQFQAYTGRLLTADIDVDINPTDASTTRSDLIVVRVEDPWLDGEPWADPTDPVVGPYIFSRVIENVPNTTTTVDELGLGYSAVALARVDLPVSTSVITDAMITDLRTVANPRTSRVVRSFYPGSTTTSTGGSFATWLTLPSVQVPEWATAVRVRGDLQGIKGTASGAARVVIGATSVVSDQVDLVLPSADPYSYTLLSEEAVPSAIRGTTQTLVVQGMVSSGTLTADTGTSVFVDLEFIDAPE